MAGAVRGGRPLEYRRRRPAWRVYRRTTLAAALMAGLVIDLAVTGVRPDVWTVAVVAAALVAVSFSTDRWRERALRAEQQLELRSRVARLTRGADGPPPL